MDGKRGVGEAERLIRNDGSSRRSFAQQNYVRRATVRATGELAKQVNAEVALGNKLGLTETPTLVVVTQHGWIQVKDVSDLYEAIDKAEASAGGVPAEHHKTRK